MSIDSIQIRHYKSLGDVYLGNLQPITILVGTNATGKSNVIDALRFLRDAAVDGLDHAISSRSGIEIIRQYSPTRPYNISMHVEFTQPVLGLNVSGYYDMTIGSAGGGNYRVEREEAMWHEEEYGLDAVQNAEARLLKRRFTRTVDGKVLFENEEPDEVPPDELFLGQRYELDELTKLFARMRFSALYPNTLRLPNRPDTDRRLKESGENWASVLKAMRQAPRGRQAFQSIVEMMKVVLPTLVEVKVKGVGGYLVPQFLVKDSEDGREHPFDPVQLSDGTLRVFGMLLALYQVPPSPFLAIEEPEQSINPAVLAMLAEAFKDVSRKTQLFVTSHSPHLIDHFEPEQIRVVTMTEGETHVAPVRASQVASIKEKLTTLEELLSQGNLFPEEYSTE
jgi:predicted ATPase